MSTETDPYRELLGIECPDGHPPDHYTLLGLPRFESDPRKIDEAAGNRMALLQEFANSEYMDASQRLLNEVSAARRCLLDTTRRIAYDEELRVRMRRQQTSPRKGGRGRRKTHPLLPVAVAAGAVFLAVMLYTFFRGQSGEQHNLTIEWPLNERQGAVLTVDGREMELPKENPVTLLIPPGRHRLVFRRDGYDDVVKTIHFKKNTRVRLKLQWVRSTGRRQ